MKLNVTKKILFVGKEKKYPWMQKWVRSFMFYFAPTICSTGLETGCKPVLFFIFLVKMQTSSTKP